MDTTSGTDEAAKDTEEPVAAGAQVPPRPSVPADADAPVSEAEALRLLIEDGPDAPERAVADKVTAIADRLAARLGDALGARPGPAHTGGPAAARESLSVGTLAFFHDTVSFGGGLNTGGGRDGRAPRGSGHVSISEHEVAEHIEHFVHPPGYEQALRTLREHGLVVLAAGAGSGREAAGVNLLAEATALLGDASPGGLHRVLGVGPTDWEPPVRAAGYLLAADAEHGLELDHAWLQRTSARLRAAGSCMVVISPPPMGALARAAGLSEVVFTGLGVPDLLDVFVRRTLGAAPGPGAVEALKQRLRDCGGLDALREQPFVRTAVRLAVASRAGADLRAEVAAARDPSEQVSQWFARNREPSALSFALAAAVLDGCSYLTVADCALLLLRRLGEDGEDPVELRFHERLAGEQHWLDVAAEPGRAAVVRFRSALLPPILLGHAWLRLDGLRPHLLGWLRDLLRHPDVEVRARAAVAAGVVGWQDPDHSLNGHVRGWAASESLPVRLGAATALGVLARTPVVGDAQERVWAAGEGWAVERGTAVERRLARTAVIAAGGQLGRAEPDRALALLRSALEWEGDWANLPDVAWSAVDLVRAGRATNVLAALLDWSRAQDLSEPVAKALSIFLRLAHQREDGLPLLLAVNPPAGLDELWARALARRPVQTPALEVLRQWVISGDPVRQPAALTELRRLLMRIAARPGKHRERLIYHLDLWQRDPARPAPAAADLWRAVRSG